jgi:branched-chain amino acid transport system permease protein
MSLSSMRKWALLVLVVLGAAVLPLLNRQVPGVFEGPFTSPGVLHLLAIMLVYGALAITYDLLFGVTGLLSFGHALYFGVGVYGTVIALSALELSFTAAVVSVLILGLVLPALIGPVCLRVGGIAFAMVTLAFAQAGAIFVMRDPLKVTGGELGRSLDFDTVPAAFVGVVNARNSYWLALGLLLFVYLVSHIATSSPTGRVWRAIRENERRVEVLGLRPSRYKLSVFVLAAFLATACGVVYVVVIGGAHPAVTAATFTLSLLVMVVLGGAGRLWGAMLGGMLYTYLDHRLGQLSSSSSVADLPPVLAVPLSEPLFILGLLFVLVVLYFPGGIAAQVTKLPGFRSSSTRGRHEQDSPAQPAPVEPAGRR